MTEHQMKINVTPIGEIYEDEYLSRNCHFMAINKANGNPVVVRAALPYNFHMCRARGCPVILTEEWLQENNLTRIPGMMVMSEDSLYSFEKQVESFEYLYWENGEATCKRGGKLMGGIFTTSTDYINSVTRTMNSIKVTRKGAHWLYGTVSSPQAPNSYMLVESWWWLDRLMTRQGEVPTGDRGNATTETVRAEFYLRTIHQLNLWLKDRLLDIYMERYNKEGELEDILHCIAFYTSKGMGISTELKEVLCAYYNLATPFVMEKPTKSKTTTK